MYSVTHSITHSLTESLTHSTHTTLYFTDRCRCGVDTPKPAQGRRTHIRQMLNCLLRRAAPHTDQPHARAADRTAMQSQVRHVACQGHLVPYVRLVTRAPNDASGRELAGGAAPSTAPAAHLRSRRRRVARERQGGQGETPCANGPEYQPLLTAAPKEQHRQRGTFAFALVPDLLVPPSGAVGVGHAAAHWQHAAHWHEAPSQHRIGDTRALLTCAARHRLNIWYKLGNGAASGRVYRC